MRLGIDLRPLQAETRFRGIGKTLEFFLKAAAPLLSKDRVVFYVEENAEIPDIVNLFNDHTTQTIPSFPLGKTRYFRSFLPSYRCAKPSNNDVGVFLQFDAMLGIPKSVPTITIFYDLIPLLFRDKERRAPVRLMRLPKDRLAGLMYWRKYLRVINSYIKSTHIIAISESSKRDYLRQYPSVDPNYIDVVPLAVDRSFFHTAREPSRHIKAMSAKPYILYVGGIDTRKNVVELIEVFYALKTGHQNLRLLLVGKEFSLHDQLSDRGWFTAIDRQSKFKKDIVYVGFVSQEDLLYLYQHAGCFIFPSLYEGFGLPILESMAAGCPVVAYDNSSLPEVAGKAAHLAETHEEFVRDVDMLLRDTRVRSETIKRGKLHAERFSWEKMAQRTIDIARKYESK